MTIVREEFLTAPQITVPAGGILTQAKVVDGQQGIGWHNNDGLYPSWNCLDTLVPTTVCPTEEPVEKEFSEADWIPGFTFSVQGGTLCRLVGYDRTLAEDELTRVFLANESKGVERALMQTRFVSTSSGVSPAWDAASDLTPSGGAVSPSVGLALLEGFSGQNYAGVPTIHIPKTVGSILAGDDLKKDDERFFTKLGSKAVVGSGYEPSNGPDGSTPDAGEFWIYASGEVLIERGGLVVREAVDYTNNEDYILAERTYRVAVDCFTAAVRVEVY